ncbi:DUF4476 domain-containing protein [Flavobacterium sp. J49]|uniref:DUF4476 domain-containing protein n=1 Tax=Flavobacterium sp. J49 TaxID=2718534 RepID=UPI001593C6EE|nr:DUF4476 domain-containing protein [Flavobacterium sp. J49]MBF6642286.1 DUF4476 domain-containing protein [Flavobacterium sp. J49]NIC03532.1 DUF4476 domain-containing protein [Flavobacterium sp. J49]
MIKKITLLVLVLISASTFAQLNGPVGHLTIFSEDGDKFTLILNGEVINDVPQTNLRVEDLNQPYYNAKIRFEDKSLMDISKNNLMLTDVDGIFSDVTYKIKRDKNNKTKMKLNYFSSIPVRPDFIPPSNVHVIHYGQPRPAPVVVQQTTTGIAQTTTTTTTQTGGATMGVGVNVGGVNMGITINDSMGGGSVTQTTTTTTTQVGGTRPVDVIEPVRGCNGRTCMTSGNFNAALATIKKQSFEDTRLKTAKQVITANCLNVDQIIQIANTFNFEDNKLDFAKYAYDYCIEPRNYFKLNGIFSFSSNVDELSDYVQSRQ